jgi:L-threonylcarbamoyladenylate synthase
MPKPIAARLYRGTSRDLARLARLLRAGELVAVPTETVYGLAANALDARACRKIFSAKGRPTTDPLIVHFHDLTQLDAIAENNDAARRLAAKFWPGPLTLVLPKKTNVPAIVSAGLPSVAVRMPAHPLFRRLLKLAGVPLAAPSANPFGYVSPTTARHVQDGLGKKIRHILDGGPATIGLESTIVDLRDPARPRLLRPGAITRAELERVLGCRVLAPPRRVAAEKKVRAQLAPGLLKRHYSPRTPVLLHETLSAVVARAGARDAAGVQTAQPAGRTTENIFWLDARGDLRGIARELFATLRRLDDGRFTKIHVALASGDGLAEAINDRLRRAAAR